MNPIAERILATLVPVLLIVLSGVIYAHYKKPDMRATNVLNMDLLVPFLIFSALGNAQIDLHSYLPLALGALVVMLLSGVVAYPFNRALGYDYRTFLPPIMFPNTGNLGLPLVLLAYGTDAMPAAAVVFVMSMVLHFTLGFYMLDRHAKVLNSTSLPTLIASAAALCVNLLEIPVYAEVTTAVEMLGQACVPLMLFSLGVRMHTVKLNDLPIALWVAMLSPVIGIGLAFALQPMLQLNTQDFAVFVVFGALPPAVLNFMVAERYNQEPAKVASIVLISNIFALLWMPVAFLITPGFATL